MIYHESNKLESFKLHKMNETVNISLENCSDLETIDPYFDVLSKEYPKLRNWLETACYDRKCICTFNTSNELIGLLIFTKKTKNKYNKNDEIKNNIYKISTLFVTNKYRRNKIATKMLSDFIDEYSPEEIYTTCYDVNDDMCSFLRKNKFMCIGKKENTNESVFTKIE